MTTILLNSRFSLQFVSHLRDYEKDLILLRRLGFKPNYEDVTRENSLSFAEGRPEVLFTIPNVSIKDAAFIKDALQRGV